MHSGNGRGDGPYTHGLNGSGPDRHNSWQLAQVASAHWWTAV
jgi:hypothetical protein